MVLADFIYELSFAFINRIVFLFNTIIIRMNRSELLCNRTLCFISSSIIKSNWNIFHHSLFFANFFSSDERKEIFIHNKLKND